VNIRGTEHDTVVGIISFCFEGLEAPIDYKGWSKKKKDDREERAHCTKTSLNDEHVGIAVAI